MNDEENYNKPIDEVEMNAILKEQEKTWRKQQIAELAEKLFVAIYTDIDDFNKAVPLTFEFAQFFIEAKEKFLANKEVEE